MRTKSTAEILATSSKIREREKAARKGLIRLEPFVQSVSAWQEARPPLHTADKDSALLTLLFLGEVAEVAEQREREGLPDYDFKSETGETIDSGFFLASFSSILQSKGKSIDYAQALYSANGQLNGSHAIERLQEVGGNLTEKSLAKDLQYLWTLWASYIIHMKHPVDIMYVLENYTNPKNDGNYSKFVLKENPIFEQAHGRKMDEDEEKEYFAHYRKTTRIIRDFIIAHVDPGIEHTGLKQEHLMPYLMYIYSFEVSGMLQMLKDQLHTDYNVPQVVYNSTMLYDNAKGQQT